MGTIYSMEGNMLNKEFLEFNNSIKLENESTVLREKRDLLKKDFQSKFPKKCESNDIEIKPSDIDVVSQGSFKLNTTIKSQNKEVDLDLGVIFPLDILEYEDSRKIKILGKEALEITGVRLPVIKEPCVTVSYVKGGEETIHLDFPMYAEYDGELYLARGKENGKYSWEVADPRGLNDYIISKITSETMQPRRIIRYLKKWKQIAYSSNATTEKKPPSIGLTLLVVDSLVEDESDLIAFRNVCARIRDQFTVVTDAQGNIVSAKITKLLPVKPFTDVFKKFERSDSHAIDFYKKISKAINNLDNALNCDNEHDAAVYVSKVLGEDFPIPEKEIKKASTIVNEEHSFG